MRGSKSYKFAGVRVIAARRREGRSSNTRKDRVHVSWGAQCTHKVSGITCDRQKQLGPWDRKLGRLFVRAPVRIDVFCGAHNTEKLDTLNKRILRFILKDYSSSYSQLPVLEKVNLMHSTLHYVTNNFKVCLLYYARACL